MTVRRCAELAFRALDAVVEGGLEVWRALLLLRESLVWSGLSLGEIHLHSWPSTDRVDGRARWSSNTDTVRIVLQAALYSVSGRKESVESLDQIRVPGEQFRDTSNHSRCIDPTTNQQRSRKKTEPHNMVSANLRLTFEVFHNVEKPIIDIRLLRKLNLDLVQVAKGILSFNISKVIANMPQSENQASTLYAIRCAMESHIEYRLLSLIHISWSRAHGGSHSGHATSEGYRLRGSTTSRVCLQWWSKHRGRAVESTYSAVWGHGAVGTWEHWVL